MPPKTEITLNVELPDDLSPLGRVREVTKRLLAVSKEEIDRREREYEAKKDQESRHTMNNEAGAFFARYHPHQPWLSAEPVYIGGQVTTDGSTELHLDTEGRFHFRAQRPDKTVVCTFISQPTDVVGRGPIPILVEWELEQVAMNVAGHAMLPTSPDETPLKFSESPTASEPLSIEHPDRISRCQTWIDNREKKFRTRRTRENRRDKTESEQRRDLEDSMKRLQLFATQLRAGEEVLFGALVSELRALIYWERDDAWEHNYNPLLLRMASKAKLPLPVWSEKDRGDFCTSETTPKYGIISGLPRIDKTHDDQELVDIQEWMQRTLVVENDPALPGGARRQSIKSALRDAAVCMGIAHYDEDISEFAIIMRSFDSRGGNVLTTYFIAVSDIVVALSAWVLSELEQRNSPT